MQTSSMSDATRGVWGGGAGPETILIDYITIASTGDSADFGDLPNIRFTVAATSNSHGGLQS